jgi:hypothetical protein
MKTNRILLAASLATSLLVGAIAHADGESSDQGVGTWEGSGQTTESSGKDSGSFTIALTRTSLGAGSVRSEGKLKTADGKEIVFWQQTTERGGGKYTIASSLGSGGGCCFSNGMCQSLETRSDGVAFASTVAKDGKDKIRVLVTELKDGHAVRFYAQTLVKKP